ncbi:GNAT family N-acetyltransferase [Mycolicibacterium porcinum]
MASWAGDRRRGRRARRTEPRRLELGRDVGPLGIRRRLPRVRLAARGRRRTRVDREDRELLAHAAVVPRTLRHADKVFDTGYVEAVAVRGDQQGRGLGRLLMDQTESIIRTRHDLGALAAVESAAQFYAARGWQPWVGPTQADTPDGVIDTYDPTDRIFLLPTDATSHDFAPSIPLICDWRAGDLW